MIWPPAISQIGYPGAGDVDDCWAVATIYAALASDPARSAPTVTRFRYFAGDPDDGFQDGGSLDECVAGARGCFPGLDVTRWKSTTWDSFAALVRAGMPASVALDSWALPLEHRYRFTGKHQSALLWSGTGFLLMNPLQQSGDPPKPIRESEIKRAVLALVPSQEVRAVLFPAPKETSDMAGLATVPAADLKHGVARWPEEATLIRVEDSVRIPIGAGGVRQAVGPFIRDFGKSPGYLVQHQGATCWAAAASLRFTPTPTQGGSFPVEVGGQLVGNFNPGG